MARFPNTRHRATDAEVLKDKEWLEEHVPGAVATSDTTDWERMKMIHERNVFLVQLLKRMVKYSQLRPPVEYIFPVAYVVDTCLSKGKWSEYQLEVIVDAALQLVMDCTLVGMSLYFPSELKRLYGCQNFDRERRRDAYHRLPKQIGQQHHWPLPSEYVRKICAALPGDGPDEYRLQDQAFSKYFSCVAALDHKFSGIIPSKLAAICLYISMLIAGKRWCDEHVENSDGYEEKDLAPHAINILRCCLKMMREQDHPIHDFRRAMHDNWDELRRWQALSWWQRKTLWSNEFGLNRSERRFFLESQSREDRPLLLEELDRHSTVGLLESLEGSEAVKKANNPTEMTKEIMASLDRSQRLELSERQGRFKTLMEGLVESPQLLGEGKLTEVRRELEVRFPMKIKQGKTSDRKNVVRHLGHTPSK